MPKKVEDRFDLDRIVELIKQGHTTHNDIFHALDGRGIPGRRRLDRSMQQLRKEGRIRYVHKNWEVVS